MTFKSDALVAYVDFALRGDLIVRSDFAETVRRIGPMTLLKQHGRAAYHIR